MYQRLSSNNGSEFLFQKENEHTVPLIYKLIQNKEKQEKTISFTKLALTLKMCMPEYVYTHI